MSQFKKSFRGYNPEQVDERLRELETQLKASETRREILENQIAEARQQADTAQSHLADHDTEFQKLKASYEHLRLEQNEKQTQAESIGRVYIKAFESGREIVEAPAPHVDRFLQDVENVARKSAQEVSGAKRDFADAADRIAALIGEIGRQAAFMNHSLENLSSDMAGLDNIYLQFDRIKDAAKADIERIKKSYEQTISDYREPSLYRTAPASPQRIAPEFSQSSPTSSASSVPADISSADSRSFFPSVPVADNSQPAVPAPAPAPASAPAPVSADSSSPAAQDFVPPANAGEEKSGQSTAAQENGTSVPAVDTAADFQEDGDTLKQAAGADTAESSQPPEQNPEGVRGQNILNLLHKYQKR